MFYLFIIYCTVAIFCEVCDEPLSSNKGRESVDQLRSFKISKECDCPVAYHGDVYFIGDDLRTYFVSRVEIFQGPLLRLGPCFSHPWQSQRVQRHYGLQAYEG